MLKTAGLWGKILARGRFTQKRMLMFRARGYNFARQFWRRPQRLYYRRIWSTISIVPNRPPSRVVDAEL